ncbi:alpha/beta fold hydrolase [Aliiroseovarius sp. Z3]|uniref:alpha/beta hydrolase n=1 Tax=Aliiroseovarius sp. Z3 TaxID=2811402 RepID=UPI0023B293DB|nr:alpha/beta fold hydrolase [Aliiroseovarius sp. Z3]MDE9451547.1 alpha/beta fold hydrolase [Aliiroseovarius sp. Z3]
MESYRDHSSWHNYRAILRSEFDLVIDCEPNERWDEVLGHDIHIDEWTACLDASVAPPTPASHGTVILVHGGGGNGRVLAPFAQSIAKMGWRVLAPDLPGFGITRPASDWRGNYEAWPAVLAELADRQDKPVVLIGASMGGLTALYAAQVMRQPPLAVVATTLLDLSDPGTFVRAARWRVLGWLSLFSARLMPWIMDRLSLPLNIAAPLEAMSANEKMTEYFQTDALLGARWLPLRFWRTTHAFRFTLPDLPCPLVLVHPRADEWTPPNESLGTFEKISSEKRFVLLPSGSHLPIEPGALAALMQEIGAVLGGS